VAYLSSSSPADYTNDFPLANLDTEITKNGRKFGAVAHNDVVEFDASLRRPFLRRAVVFEDGGSFLREVVSVVEDAFDRVEVVFNFRTLADHPGEGSGDGEDVGEDETGLGRVDNRPV
jgi:hypothetical protein